jgi:hypothetical protein
VKQKAHILILSFYAPPYQSVGVHRASYWHKHFPAHDIQSTLFTAIEQDKAEKTIHYVPVDDSKDLLSFLIKDQGIHWKKPLKSKLANYSKNAFTHILITGGPFMHMGLNAWLKKKFNAEIILDFRDPFYGNPRFNSSWVKNRVKKYFQNRFLQYADKVITVNEACANLIDFNNIFIVENGYQDDVLEQITLDDKKTKRVLDPFAIGKIYPDFNISPFHKALKNLNITLHYVGDYDFGDEDSGINKYGSKKYEEAIQIMDQYQNCILFTGGHPFESTTKVFDYLALNKNILIITQGEQKTGALNEITKDYPNTFWAVNNATAIEEALKEMMLHTPVLADPSKFSRKAGLNKLVNLLSV